MESINAGIWSIVPPLVAIVLALITKEVVFSLLMGILSGTIIYSVFMSLGAVGVFDTTVNLMFEKIGDNASMIVFLCFLGILVSMVNRAGGSKAYGDWASSKLKTKSAAAAATSGLGVLIFIDDYFNCLTVGTVMRPVTDRVKMSREKLAYIIDATAAPVCIIAPISSWAASVISYYPNESGMSGMSAFVRAIPMNLYAILTLFMIFWLAFRKNSDYGPMAAAEHRAETTGIITTDNEYAAQEEMAKLHTSDKGKVIDLVLPIAILVVLCIASMLYVGGYWSEGLSFKDAFGNTDAGVALALGSFVTLLIAFFIFVPRKLMSFKGFFECVGDGVKNMVSACIILTLAWTISGVCRDLLGTGPYVADLVRNSGLRLELLPAIIFIVACLLSFATGTSWGTFGILIPIVVAITTELNADYLTVTVLSATLAGAVFGDHCSPISDTTILASTGAGCNHLAHVGTQFPYAATVAVCCFIGYLVAGFLSIKGYGISLAVTLPVAFGLLIGALIVLPRVWKPQSKIAAK